MKRRTNKPAGPSFESKSCTGKKKYRSEAEALDMLEAQRGYGKEMDGISPYRCGFCGKWHLGHRFKF